MRGHLISGITGGLCAALLLCLFGAGRTDTLVARQILLVDASGNTVGQIGTDAENQPFMQFKDASGNVRLQFALANEAGTPGRTTQLKLSNHDGSVASVLGPTTLPPNSRMASSWPGIYERDGRGATKAPEDHRARIYLLGNSK